MHIRLAASSPTAAPIPPRRAAGLRCARIRNARIRVQSADSGGITGSGRGRLGIWGIPGLGQRSGLGAVVLDSIRGGVEEEREIFGESRGGWVSHGVTGSHVSAIQN